MDGVAGRLLHVTTTDMSLVLLLGPQLQAFSDAGYEVVTCSAAGPYVPEIESWGLRHVALEHLTRAMDPVADLRAFAEMVSLFRSLRPDVVHTHNPKPGVLGRFAARVAGVPAVVNTVHGLYAQPSDSFLRRSVVYAAERLASTCSDAELVLNPEDLATLRGLGVPGERLTLVGNGIDLARYRPGEPGSDVRSRVRGELGVGADDVLVGVVGRLVWEKGYRELFAAAERWFASQPNLRVVVVGPEEESKGDAVDSRSIEAARAKGIRFLGLRSDMERLYCAFDIYVLASHREGLPRSAMEAAAMGLPIVATDIRGCRQVVDNGVTGLLVPPREPTALADAVLRLAASPAERRAMGAAGMEKARREFDQQRVIDLTLETYERLLRPRALPVARQADFSLRLATPRDAIQMAELHRSELPESFLSSLGKGFLVRLYRRIVRSPGSFAIVASDAERRMAGFVAGTVDTRALYRRFLLHDGLVAGLLALPRLLVAPRHVVETLRYGSVPAALPAELPPGELLSIAVHPGSRGRGVGRALVDAFEKELGQRSTGGARVVVDSGNAVAVGLYERSGFRHIRSFELHRGSTSEVLVWP